MCRRAALYSTSCGLLGQSKMGGTILQTYFIWGSAVTMDTDSVLHNVCFVLILQDKTKSDWVCVTTKKETCHDILDIVRTFFSIFVNNFYVTLFTLWNLILIMPDYINTELVSNSSRSTYLFSKTLREQILWVHHCFNCGVFNAEQCVNVTQGKWNAKLLGSR